ncbi:surface protease GP63, partial [Trypanosoma theileri]
VFKKIHMRCLLCTALLLLCCAYGCIAAVVQPLPQRGQGPWDTYTVAEVGSDHVSGKDNFQPIRFAVSAKEFDRVMKYCKHLNGDLDEDQEGDKYDPKKDKEEYGFEIGVKEINDDFCDEEGHNTVTPGKKRTLLREVLPAALKLHSERLSVKREEENLIVRKDKHEFSSKCAKVSIPKQHQEHGVPNVDFVLYVGVTDTSVPVQICSKNEKGRPTSALIKFVPEEIDATRHFIRFAAHEVAHALGFEIETMKEYVKEGNEMAGKKKVSWVTYPTVIKEVNKHYGCPIVEGDSEIKGMALENDATDGAPLHWERRIAKDELMSTYSSSSNGMFYTALTLAVFDSMPFYKAEFKMAESMSWGKDAGCDFLKDGKEKKDEIIQNKPKMFCDEVKPTLQCSSDRLSLGMCSMGTSDVVEIPFEYQKYFGTVLYNSDNDLMDGYPIIKAIPQTSCERDQLDLMPGSDLGKESRCLKGENLTLKEQNKNNLTVGDICAKVKCEKDNNTFKVQYKGSTNWHECKNGKIEVTEGTEFTGGSIVCPTYAEVCTELSSTIDFNITYDEGEKRLMDEEDRREAEEEEEIQRIKVEAEAERNQKEEEHQKVEKEKEVISIQGPSLPPDSEMKENHSKPAEHSAGEISGKQPVASPQAGNQGGAPAEGESEVLSPPASTAPQPAGEENKAPNGNNNNSTALPQEPSSIPPEKNSSEPAKKPEVENMPNTENPKPVASEPIAVSEQPSSIKEEDKNNTTEGIEQVRETSTQPQPQNGNDEGINTTVDPTHSPNSPATVDENKNETTVNTDNNKTNTTTSSIPENVNASATAPATLTGLNNTQMGQVINQATTIAIVGADSSIATSYQIPLLLLFFALVALASP